MIVECKGKSIDFGEEYIVFWGLFNKKIDIDYNDIKKIEFKININREKNNDASKIVDLKIYTKNHNYYCCINYDDNGKVESFLRNKNIKISKKFIESRIYDSYGD